MRMLGYLQDKKIPWTNWANTECWSRANIHHDWKEVLDSASNSDGISGAYTERLCYVTITLTFSNSSYLNLGRKLQNEYAVDMCKLFMLAVKKIKM